MLQADLVTSSRNRHGGKMTLKGRIPRKSDQQASALLIVGGLMRILLGDSEEDSRDWLKESGFINGHDVELGFAISKVSGGCELLAFKVEMNDPLVYSTLQVYFMLDASLIMVSEEPILYIRLIYPV